MPLPAIIVLSVLGYILGGFITALIMSHGDRVEDLKGWIFFIHLAWPLVAFIGLFIYYPCVWGAKLGKHYMYFLHQFGGYPDPKPDVLEGKLRSVKPSDEWRARY